MHNISLSILTRTMICAILAITAAAPANARQEFSIQSESTDDTREIIVHLPTDYDPDRDEGYPVIYMLDAGSKDKLTAEIASYYYWGDLMPELIVVGLKNVNRGLDFLPHYYDVENNDGEQVYGNGDKLLAYIENELIPFVDNQFNTNGDNSFSGHSWGGQFLTYALSQSPGLFDAYFITSPSFGSAGEWSQKTFDALELALKRDYEFPDLVYVSVGGDGAPGALSDAGLLPEYYRLVGLLRRHLPEQVELRHEIHDIANHTSNGAISMAKALQLYFAAAPVSE